jgi:histidinol-phosphate aminotransferase
VTDSLRFHGDRVAQPGMVDFAVSVWPGRRPRRLRRAMAAALESQRYPDERGAREAVARRVDRPVEEVLLLNGAAEGFWLLAHALRPKRALCVHPSFTEGEAALRASGCEVERAFRRDGDFALDAGAVSDDADWVLVCSPNNPTGNLDPARELEKLVRPGRLLVVDEAFMDFARTSHESLVERRDLPGVVVLRSFTKLWGIAGIRAGYLTAGAELVERLEFSRQPWSVNAVACAAIEACASDRTTRKRVGREVAAARLDVEARLEALTGVRVWPSAVNFVLVEVPDGEAVLASLADAGFAVRPAAGFPGLGRNHLRLAVREPAENRALVDALAAAVGAPLNASGGSARTDTRSDP